jgi:hypothetical protein
VEQEFAHTAGRPQQLRRLPNANLPSLERAEDVRITPHRELPRKPARIHAKLACRSAQAMRAAELGELIERGDLLHMREIHALQVLDQPENERLLIGSVPLDGPQHVQAGALVSQPSPLPTHQLVLTAVLDPPNDDRLQLTPLPQRVSQFVERLLVESRSGAPRARPNASDWDQKGALAARLRRGTLDG